MVIRNNLLVVLGCIIWGKCMSALSPLLAPGGLVDSVPLMKLLYLVIILCTCIALSYGTSFLSKSNEWVINLLSIILVPLLFSIGILIQNQTLLFLGYGPLLVLTLGFTDYQLPAALAFYACFGYVFLILGDNDKKYLRNYTIIAAIVVTAAWIIRSS